MAEGSYVQKVEARLAEAVELQSVERALREQAERERNEWRTLADELAAGLLGTAGQLETPTGLGIRSDDAKLTEYARRCVQAAEQLRALAAHHHERRSAASRQPEPDLAVYSEEWDGLKDDLALQDRRIERGVAAARRLWRRTGADVDEILAALQRSP